MKSQNLCYRWKRFKSISIFPQVPTYAFWIQHDPKQIFHTKNQNVAGWNQLTYAKIRRSVCAARMECLMTRDIGRESPRLVTSPAATQVWYLAVVVSSKFLYFFIIFPAFLHPLLLMPFCKHGSKAYRF